MALLVIAGLLGMSHPAAAEDFRSDNRLLRISKLAINDGSTDGADGDGDGIAECGETIVIEVELTISNYSPRLTLLNPSLRVDARSRVAQLVGNDASTVPNGFRYGETHVAPHRFTVVIDDDAPAGESIYFVVDVPSDNHTTFRRHRHIPVMCGVNGDGNVDANGNPYANTYAAPQITMPLFGNPSFTSTWLADRPSLIHEGVDLFDAQMTPVLAAANGTVSGVLWQNDLAHMGPIGCCSVSIIHDDGWESWYSHLNNDTPGTDDDLGDAAPLAWQMGYRPGLEVGDRVLAGEVIGWVGDSGNAKFTRHHLHFELHDPAGNPVNPYAALLAADVPSHPYPCTATGGVCRVAGANRYETAVAASQQSHPSGADVVYLAVGTNFPDAIAAGPAAAAEGAPILLVGPALLPTVTRTELMRLDPSRVVVLGGTQAARPAVVDAVRAALPNADVQRRGGDHRYETAVQVTRNAFAPGVATLYVATGESFADAVIAASAAVADGAPLLLARPTGLDAVVRSEIERLAPGEIVIIGGTTALPMAVEQDLRTLAGAVRRISGSNRYAVSAGLSADRWATASTVYVAVGDDYPDALAAGPLTRVDNGPVLLVPRHMLLPVIGTELLRLQPDRIVILGGPVAVSTTVYWLLGAYLYRG